ncbi:cadmium/zinc-transporting P1B-ATPase 3 isoform HMA3.1 [Hordeum vulgare]|nr:cadmium/zinc-transporting P1B-ATPase 3 isoform HMA3.1 [Hordeum vulgare]
MAQPVHRRLRRPPPRILLQVAPASPAVAGPGAACAGAPPMVLRGFAAASRLALDINILMLIAVVGAVALKDYTEAGVIVFLFTTAEWLETLACTKASAGMSSLMSMIPPKAVLAETGEVVNVRDIDVGAVIAVRAGEMVPVDGVVVDGQSEVDERSLTGESYPVPKQPLSEVWAGTLNLDGYIAVRTSALAENSTVAKMERLVEEAQQSKSKTQRLIDSCAKYYTPAVVFLGAGVALLPPLLGARDAERWFRLALVLLVSACPCALVLSTPVATFCALLTAARMGVLVKGGDILESLGEIKVVAFDKTGTITRGEFTVDMFDVVGHKVQMSQLLYWISSIESKSSHPMAAALVEYAQSKSIEPKPECVAEFRILPGEGIYGEIDGKRIYVGNKRVLARASSCQTAVPERMNGLKGVSIGYVICDGDLVGVFSLSDDCRTGAAEAIRELASMGISSVLLTGDSAEAAVHAQERLGGALEELHSELFPEDKVRLGPRGRQARQARRRTIAVNMVSSVAAKVAVLALALAWRPVLWAAVLADVGTCLLVVLNSMLLLGEGGGRREKEEACRATARSLEMRRSQLAAVSSDASTKGVGKTGVDASKGCHCCHKPSKSPEHSVVINVRVDEHVKGRRPRHVRRLKMSKSPDLSTLP